MASSGRRNLSPTRAEVTSARARACTPEPQMDFMLASRGSGIFGQRLRSFDGSAAESPYEGSPIGQTLVAAGISRPGIYRAMVGVSTADVIGGVVSTGMQAAAIAPVRSWEQRLAAEAETAAAVNGGPGAMALRAEQSAPSVGRDDVASPGTEKRRRLLEARRRASMRVAERGKAAAGAQSRAGRGGALERDDRDDRESKNKDPLAFLPPGMARAAMEEAGRKAREQATNKDEAPPRLGFLVPADVATIRMVLQRTVEAATLAAAAEAMEGLLPGALEDHMDACFGAEAAKEASEAAAKRAEEQRRKDMARLARKQAEERLSVRSRRAAHRTSPGHAAMDRQRVFAHASGNSTSPERWSRNLQGRVDADLAVSAVAALPAQTSETPVDAALRRHIRAAAESCNPGMESSPGPPAPQGPIDPKYRTVTTSQDLNVLDESDAQHYSRHFLSVHSGRLQTVGPSGLVSSHQNRHATVARGRSHARPSSAVTMSSGRVASSSPAGGPKHRQLGGTAPRLRALSLASSSSSAAFSRLPRTASHTLGRPQSALMRVVRDNSPGEVGGPTDRPLMTINRRSIGGYQGSNSTQKRTAAKNRPESFIHRSVSAGAALLDQEVSHLSLTNSGGFNDDGDGDDVDAFESFLEKCSSEVAIAGIGLYNQDSSDSNTMPHQLEASQSCMAVMDGPAPATALPSSRRSSRLSNSEEPERRRLSSSSSRRNSTEKPADDSVAALGSFMSSESLVISMPKPLQGRPSSAKMVLARPSLDASPSAVRAGMGRQRVAGRASAGGTNSCPRTPGSSARKKSGKPGSSKPAVKRSVSASQGFSTSQASRAAPPSVQTPASQLDDDAVHKRLSRIMRHQAETMDDEKGCRYS